MNKTIAALIIELSSLTCDIHCKPFAERLADLQNKLGQDDGGFAGVFFFGHEDWDRYTVEEKRDLLVDYVRQELEGLVATDTE